MDFKKNEVRVAAQRPVLTMQIQTSAADPSAHGLPAAAFLGGFFFLFFFEQYIIYILISGGTSPAPPHGGASKVREDQYSSYQHQQCL